MYVQVDVGHWDITNAVVEAVNAKHNTKFTTGDIKFAVEYFDSATGKPKKRSGKNVEAYITATLR
jgi:hypothetical protein